MTRRLVIPLRTYSAELSLLLPEHTLSEADWAVLMAVLQAMKPALVEPDFVDAQIAAPLLDDDEVRDLAHVALAGDLNSPPTYWHADAAAWAAHALQIADRATESS